MISKSVVSAPVSGYVENIYPKIGEMAALGMPVAKIVNTSKVEIVANVSEAYVGKFKKGDTVTINFPNLDLEMESQISSVGQFINNNNRTFDVRVVLKNKEGNFKPNMLGTVSFKDYFNPSVVSVPTKTIQYDRKGSYVFVTKQKEDLLTAKKMYVETGNTFKGKTEILKGLSPSETLISEGISKIIDGDAIKVN